MIRWTKMHAVGLMLIAFTFPVWAEEAQMPPKETLMEKPVELSTTKVVSRVFKITLPKGFKTPAHVHDGPGPRYVLKGRVRIEQDGAKQEFGPGQVFWETGDVMTAENVCDGEAELVIFEIAPQKPAGKKN